MPEITQSPRNHHAMCISNSHRSVPSPIDCIEASTSRLVVALIGIRTPASAAGMYIREASKTLPYQESGMPDTKALDTPTKLGRSNASDTDPSACGRTLW